MEGVLDWRHSTQPNLSEGVLVIIVFMKFSRTSTSPFVPDECISQTSVSKTCQFRLLFAENHFIFFRDSVPWMRRTVAWRDLTLCYESWPCTSSVLPWFPPAHCSWFPSSTHFICLWCIWKPLWSLHVLSHRKQFVVDWSFPSDSNKSALFYINKYTYS